MTQPSHYTYADGSANFYILTPSSLEYKPVKPEESSSGLYNGGEPKKITITAEQFTSACEKLEAAINNSEVHIKDRIKMSGAISVSDGHNTKMYIILPSCSEQIEIEKILKEMISE